MRHNGSNFFKRPINRDHQILTYIHQHLSRGWNHWSLLVTDKNYIRQWLRQQKQRVNDWVSNAYYKRGWVRPTVYCHIAPCLSKVCIVSKNKISDKCLHSSLKISYGRQYQAIWRIFVSNCFMKKQWITRQH